MVFVDLIHVVVVVVVVVVGVYLALTWDQRRFSIHDDVSNGTAVIIQKTAS